MKSSSGNQVSRRFLLSGLLAGTGQAAFAGAPLTSLRPVPRPKDLKTETTKASDAIIAATGLSGKVGFVVADARSGRILESRNPLLGMPPASVAKALTAQYALDALGPTHAFTTRLMGTGPLVDGQLQGDLILVGGGDPTLDTDGLADMATALKSAGVREVTGAFLVSGGKFPHIGQIDKAQPAYLGYNPAISGLNLNYNRVHFEWKKASKNFAVTMDARSAKFRPDVNVAKMAIVNRRSPVYTYDSQNGIDSWTVASGSLGNGGSRWLPVRQPELYAADVFQTFARSHGINLKPALLAVGAIGSVLLVERKSRPLQRILTEMLKYSTNLTAEVVGISASVARGRSIHGLRTSATAMNQWAGDRLGTRRVRLIDHSGLGDDSRISAGDMVTTLLRIGPDSTLASMLKPIPVRNANGNVVSGGSVSIHAKTGTLNFVSGLAGYINLGHNRDLAFAIFAADLDRKSAIPDASRERPPGARGWNGRARRVQQKLIARWADLYQT